jgi:hypothetical protein
LGCSRHLACTTSSACAPARWCQLPPTLGCPPGPGGVSTDLQTVLVETSKITREPTLAWLAANRPDRARLGLMAGEPETMRQVAENLVAFAGSRGLDEDDGCYAWAEQVDGLEHAHRLDPVVGRVSGIGPALFALMRMRCGGIAIKPDVRVRTELHRLGFEVPAGEHAILVVADAAAAELGVDLLVLDQLLWWAKEHREPLRVRAST